MNGTIVKTFKSLSAGFFFVKGDDGREYFVARKCCINRKWAEKNWRKLVKIGAKVSFTPVEVLPDEAANGKKNRPIATGITFTDPDTE